MDYEVLILRKAQKELANLPKPAYPRIRDFITTLSSDPKLTGREGWRIRSGDYRIIYDVDDRQRRVTVLHIGHRKDVYA